MALYTPKDTSGYTIPTTGQVLYVSPTGNTTNSGTSASAPVTFARAMSLATTGATILVANGTYDEQFLITKNVIVKAMPGHNPLIDGAEVVTGWTQEGSNWVSTSHTPAFNIVPIYDARELRADVPQAKNLQQFWLNEQYLTGVANLTALGAGKFYYQEATSTAPAKVYIRDNPTGKTVRGIARGTGLKVNSSSASNAKVIGINSIRHANYNIQVESASNVEVRDCIASYSSYSGIWSNGGSGKYINNDIEHNGHCGVKGGFLKDNNYYSGNTIMYNNKHLFSASWAAAQMKTNQAEGTVFVNNKIGGSLTCSALWFDTDNRQTEISNNTFIGANIGVFIEISGSTHIVNNLFVDCNVGHLNAASEDVVTVNNTYRNCNIDNQLKDDNRLSGGHRYTPEGVAFITRRNTFMNNYHENNKNRVYDAPTLSASIHSASYISKLENNQYVNPTNFAKWTGAVRDKLYATLALFRADFPTLDNSSTEVASIPATKLAAKPAPDATTLRLLGGTQPARVGSTVSQAPVVPPTYVAPTEEEYNELIAVQNALQSRVAELEDEAFQTGLEIVRLENLVTTLTTRRDELLVQVQGLQSDKTALQAQITTLNQQLATANGTIATLQGQVSQLQQDKTALQASITTLQQDKIALQASITTLEQDKVALQGNITSLQQANTDLTSQLSVLEADKVALQAEITRLNGILADMSEEEALQLENDQLRATVDALTLANSGLEAKVVQIRAVTLTQDKLTQIISILG